MAIVVEMARGVPDEQGFASYSCAGRSWEALLALAREFGWEPRGAVPDPQAMGWHADYMHFFKPTYEPEE